MHGGEVYAQAPWIATACSVPGEALAAALRRIIAALATTTNKATSALRRSKQLLYCAPAFELPNLSFSSTIAESD